MSINLINNFVVIARDSTIDQTDQTVSIFKIIDQLSFTVKKAEFGEARAASQGKPISIPFSCVVCSSWALEDFADTDVELKIEYSIIDPEGGLVSSGMQEARISKGSDKLRFNMNIEGFAFNGNGKYTYLLKALDNSSKELASGETHLRVNCIQE